MGDGDGVHVAIQQDCRLRFAAEHEPDHVAHVVAKDLVARDALQLLLDKCGRFGFAQAGAGRPDQLLRERDQIVFQSVILAFQEIVHVQFLSVCFTLLDFST